jgi:hypothetical protein
VTVERERGSECVCVPAVADEGVTVGGQVDGNVNVRKDKHEGDDGGIWGIGREMGKKIKK